MKGESPTFYKAEVWYASCPSTHAMSSTAANASGSRTFQSLGASNWWHSAALLAALIVAATAFAARYRIAADDDGTRLVADAYPGLVRARDVTTVALPAPITVKNVMVLVGDHVSAGQVLLTVDDTEGARAFEQLRFERGHADAALRQLNAALAAIDHSLAVLTRASGEANAHLAIAQRESDAVPVR